MICLRTTAHTGPINALPFTTRWCWCPTMRRHPRGRLNRLHCCHPLRCHQHKSPLTNKGGAQHHQLPPRCLWHKRINRTTRLGGWHLHPCLLGRQCHRIPLAALCPLGEWGGEYTQTAWPTLLSDGVTQSSCLTSLACSSHRLDPVAIADWAACACPKDLSRPNIVLAK